MPTRLLCVVMCPQPAHGGYFGYVEMDDFACYVLADSLDAEPSVNSAKLVAESMIRDFIEAPTFRKGRLEQYVRRAHRELINKKSGMHLKVAVVVAVTDYRKIRYVHVENSRFYLIRSARIEAEAASRAAEEAAQEVETEPTPDEGTKGYGPGVNPQ